MINEDEEEINTSGVGFLVALLVIFVSLLCFRISRSIASDQIIDSGSISEDSQGVIFDDNSNQGDLRPLIILKAAAVQQQAATDASLVSISNIDPDKKLREEDTKKKNDLKEDAEEDAKLDDTSSSDSKLEQEQVTNDNTWRCVCENGFLPPGMLKSFTSFEAVTRMSTGNCYHKAS
mmetsp:Transcript_7256/g.10347  ORF Transcript_7256/g.10347 Transcript_7256/m.10347 type:complete len:177 (-) Transcript_7256:109-639(-)